MIEFNSTKIIYIKGKSYTIALYNSTNDGNVFLSENEARQYSEGIIASNQYDIQYEHKSIGIKKKRNGVPPKRKDLPF